MGILHDAPANCLPLSKFTELYEKRYLTQHPVSSLLVETLETVKLKLHKLYSCLIRAFLNV